MVLVFIVSCDLVLFLVVYLRLGWFWIWVVTVVGLCLLRFRIVVFGLVCYGIPFHDFGFSLGFAFVLGFCVLFVAGIVVVAVVVCDLCFNFGCLYGML